VNLNLNATLDVVVDDAPPTSFASINARSSPRAGPRVIAELMVDVNDQGSVDVHVHVDVKVNVPDWH